MYSVFGYPGTLLLIIIIIITILYGRNEPLVRYCFLCSCVVASDLYSTVSYGGAVQTPGAMCTCRGCTISQQNRVVRTSAFGCLNWAGSISFVRTFLRGYLWASPTTFFFFFFVDVGNQTNVFFVQEHILVKFGALRVRIIYSRDKSL